MNAQELRAFLPGALGETLDQMPPDLAEGFAYLAACAEARNAGTAGSELPTIDEWWARGSH